MKRLCLICFFLLPWSTLAGQGVAGKTAADLRDPVAVKEVLARQRDDANAAWWGFDLDDSTGPGAGGVPEIFISNVPIFIVVESLPKSPATLAG